MAYIPVEFFFKMFLNPPDTMIIEVSQEVTRTEKVDISKEGVGKKQGYLMEVKIIRCIIVINEKKALCMRNKFRIFLKISDFL